MTQPLHHRWRIIIAGLFLTVAVLVPSSCAKVRVSPYQAALQRYYGQLRTGTTAEQLQVTIAGLDEDLKKHGDDPGLHMLRANARLELLRFNVTKAPSKKFDYPLASALFEELRQIQSLIDHVGAPLWMRARIPTMLADALLLYSSALGLQELAGEDEVRQNIVLLESYRIASDWFLRAASIANNSLEDIKGKDSELINKPGLMRELDNARDGYINALSGMAQSEEFLTMSTKAQEHLLSADGLAFGRDSLPKVSGTFFSRSLYPHEHRANAIRARALESLSPNDVRVRLPLVATALREDILARLLSDSGEEATLKTLVDATTYANYLSRNTLQADEVTLSNPGNVASESISFNVQRHRLYRHEGFRPSIPMLQIQVGEERFPIALPSVKPTDLIVPAKGIRISVFTGTGENRANETDVVHFLKRTGSIFPKGSKVVVIGPDDQVMATTTVPAS